MAYEQRITGRPRDHGAVGHSAGLYCTSVGAEVYHGDPDRPDLFARTRLCMVIFLDAYWRTALPASDCGSGFNPGRYLISGSETFRTRAASYRRSRYSGVIMWAIAAAAGVNKYELFRQFT